MATASVFVMNLDKAVYDENVQPMESHINVGSGFDITIAELANAVAKVINYQGRLAFDPSKPDGPPRKQIDSGRLNQLGWVSTVPLETGLHLAYLAMCN